MTQLTQLSFGRIAYVSDHDEKLTCGNSMGVLK